MSKKYLFLSIALVVASSYAQTMDVLSKIEDLQCQDHEFYRDGLFPSPRSKRQNKNIRDDNNIFFTALIVYTLQSVSNGLSPEELTMVDRIKRNAVNNYPYYKNRNGDITYNFWQVRPVEMQAPNSKFFSGMKRARLPDDLDDTSLIYMTLQTSDSMNQAIKQKMGLHTNSGKKKLKSTFKRYRNKVAYCTWFADKMKQEFDLCVMANVLLFSIEKELPMNQADSQTIQFIEETVLNEDHIKFPHIVSPQYKNTSIILYHLSRVISMTTNETLNNLREKVIKDLKDQLQSSSNSIERIALLSSLYRLDQNVPFDIDFALVEKDAEAFFWFQANPFSGSGMFTKKIVGRSNILQFRYRCEAYYWALLLELQHLSGATYASTPEGRRLTREDAL